MFLMGKVPSGSEDPFALRRKAAGIVLSTLKGKYDFDLVSLIDYSLDLYLKFFNFKSIDNLKITSEIKDFIITRYRFLLEKKGRKLDILESILGSGCSSILDIDLRYSAIEGFIRDGDIKKISTPMIRCKNIINEKEFEEVDPKLFVEEYEEKLFSYINTKETAIKDYISRKDYLLALAELNGFGKLVDSFFDEVLVMDKDKRIRFNRINLIKKAVNLYIMLADFSKLTIENNSNL